MQNNNPSTPCCELCKGYGTNKKGEFPVNYCSNPSCFCHTKPSALSVGDKVNKISGYEFPGTIVSVFQTTKGETRYVVEMDGYGLLHIFSGTNLKKV